MSIGPRIIVAALVLYLVLALASALTRRPGCDEGWFSNPAFNLITKGSMGTTVLEPANVFAQGRNLRGIDRYTYWILPLNVLVQAVWYEIFGFSLFSMRALSMAWGLVALAAWLVILKTLSGDRKVIILGVSLIAVDYVFIRGASNGRMDMMSAALNFAGFAAYLSLRERNLAAAIFTSEVLVAASCFTHPSGIPGFFGLLFLVLYFDRRRLGRQHGLIALAPYLVGAMAWGLYILQAPDLFLSQFRGNAANRLWTLTAPWTGLKREITDRYLALESAGSGFFKSLLAAPYAAAVISALLTRELRQQKRYRALLILTGIYFAYFWLFEGTKLYLYLVHMAPLYVAMLAACAGWWWDHRYIPRWLIATGIGALVLLDIGGVTYVVKRNDYRNSYLPAADFIKRRASANELIMGSAELGFALRFPDNFIDDVRLGFASGKRADMIVIEQRYADWFSWARAHEPEAYRYITNFLNHKCRLAYDHAFYKIYLRREIEPHVGY